MLPVQFSSQTTRLFAWFSVLTTAAIFIILPVPETMALINGLLLISLISAAILILNCPDKKSIFDRPAILLFFALFGWVIFHATFISENGNEAWRELWTQWAKPFIAMICGIGCALSYPHIKGQKFKFILLFALLFQPVLFLIDSLIHSFQIGKIVQNYWGVFDHKMSLTFFSQLMVAFAASRLNKQNNNLIWIQIVWVLIIALGFYVAAITDSVNSTIILILICTALLISKLASRKIKFSVAQSLIAIVIASIVTISLANSLQTNAKWRHISTDAKVAFDIEHYPNWQNTGALGIPLNNLNQPVNHSDYLRIAYARAGVEAIIEHPLGYGISRHAFERLVQKKYPDARIANSHNAYIDLTTAIGVPGLILLIAAILALFKQAKQSAHWGGITRWMIGSMMVYWLIDPVSRDHYFYALLLLIGLFSVLTLDLDESNPAAQTSLN